MPLYHIIDSIVIGDSCRTDARKLPNTPCVFPFIYKGSTHRKCTRTDIDTPWCATEVNDNGKLTKWKYCAPDCPVER